MSSHMNVNGLRIDADGDKITIDLSSRGLNKGCKSDVLIEKDGTIKGDVEGNIFVGDNVTLIIEGDVMGNITGDKVEVKGDVMGNITGGTIKH